MRHSTDERKYSVFWFISAHRQSASSGIAHNFFNKEDSQKNPLDLFCPNGSKEDVEQVRRALRHVYAKLSVVVVPGFYISDDMCLFAIFFTSFSCRKQKKITIFSSKFTKIWPNMIDSKARKASRKKAHPRAENQ